MHVPLLLFLSDLILWIALFLHSAVRVTATEFSDFELARLISNGDKHAATIKQREIYLPRVQTVRRVILAVLLVIATALTISVFGWLLGIAIASVLSGLLGTGGRIGPVARFSQRMYDRYEPWLLERVSSWPVLDWIRGAADQPKDFTAQSKAELQHAISRSSSVMSRDELLRVQASLALDTHTVQDVMTPVSVLEVAQVDDSLGPLVLDDLHKTGHSRFPVIDRDVHHVVGILYLHDIINLKSAKPTVREAMDPRVHYIHENQSLEHALHGFLRTHRHLFIVVNDYRETVGVLTLEDILETLLGKKIVDEFDQYEDLRAVAESNPRKYNSPKGKTDI